MPYLAGLLRRALRQQGRQPLMPFDGFDPRGENPGRLLELIEERLQGGRMWARGCMLVADGRTCLLGAHYSVARRFNDNGVAGRALQYLAQAIEPKARSRSRRTRRRCSITIVEFNDNCSGYDDIERVLHKAQELARPGAAPTSATDFGCFEKTTHPRSLPVAVRHEVQCIS
jgi:hypothetical protein